MAYAVVIFNNNDASEVSSNWLETNDGKPSCWWPANCKNISTLIKKRSEPDKNGIVCLLLSRNFAVRILFYYRIKEYLNYKIFVVFIYIKYFLASLEKARKVAENANYVTTDDDQLGKGRRKVIFIYEYQASHPKMPKMKINLKFWSG